MTYKDTLFFIGKSLTINHVEKNKIEIERELKANAIDWDAVVKVSTEHYVFPALYCIYKRANFLNYLPEELVSYMEHITNLNRERNQQIIIQAKEINELLLANNITPIFLKGTGNLLEGLYEDIGERMVGDIDFIIDYKDYNNTIEILFDSGYTYVAPYAYYLPSKHFPRIQKEGKIAAVEIHKELVVEKYTGHFNYDLIKPDIQLIKGVRVMNYQNQLSLSILAKQINDDGYVYKNMALRNGYDVFLLSQKTETKQAIKNWGILEKPLNCFLAICYEVFSKPSSLSYQTTENTKNFVASFYNLLENEKYQKKFNSKTKQKLFILKRVHIIIKSFTNTNYRKWLLKKLTDKNWYREKGVQLGLIKLKN